MGNHRRAKGRRGSPSVRLGTGSADGNEAKKGSEICLLSSFGDYRLTIESPAPKILHLTVRLTPVDRLNNPWWPRDLYILGNECDPTKAPSEVFAARMPKPKSSRLPLVNLRY